MSLPAHNVQHLTESVCTYLPSLRIRLLKMEIFRDGSKMLKHILTRICALVESCLDLFIVKYKKVHFKSVSASASVLTDF